MSNIVQHMQICGIHIWLAFSRLAANFSSLKVILKSYQIVIGYSSLGLLLRNSLHRQCLP